MGELGPIFVATLQNSSTYGVDNTNNLGIWAVVNSEYEVALIFRTGEPVDVNGQVKTVRTFVALTDSPGSVGAANGYDDCGDVGVLATFTDGTTALLNVEVPGEGIQ